MSGGGGNFCCFNVKYLDDDVIYFEILLYFFCFESMKIFERNLFLKLPSFSHQPTTDSIGCGSFECVQSRLQFIPLLIQFPTFASHQASQDGKSKSLEIETTKTYTCFWHSITDSRTPATFLASSPPLQLLVALDNKRHPRTLEFRAIDEQTDNDGEVRKSVGKETNISWFSITFAIGSMTMCIVDLAWWL